MNNTRWIVLGVIVLAICATLWKCNADGWLRPRPVVRDTVSVVVDSVVFVNNYDTVYVPRETWRSRIDSFISFANVDTALILRQFFVKHAYKDTVYKSKYGTVVVQDTVYCNTLSSRRVRANIRVPGTITRTVTLRDTVGVSDRRLVGYIGIEGYGWPVGGGLSLGFKLPSGTYMGVKGMMWRGKAAAGVEIKLPIHLKR